MSSEPMKTREESTREEHTWTEQIEIRGSELVERTKELIQEGNVRRLIIRDHEDKVLLEVPLTASVAVGGVVVLLAPVLAALGGMAALLARVKLEIVRTSDGGEGKDPNIEEDRRELETPPPDYQRPPQQEAR